jgi:hypothetical protein
LTDGTKIGRRVDIVDTPDFGHHIHHIHLIPYFSCGEPTMSDPSDRAPTPPDERAYPDATPPEDAP